MSVTRIDPDASTLAATIANGLWSDLKAKRISAIGREQIADAIEARALALSSYDQEHLIELVCRRIVFKAT